MHILSVISVHNCSELWEFLCATASEGTKSPNPILWIFTRDSCTGRYC